MSNDRKDETSTTFFVNATGFTIKRGRFRTVGGNSYTNCDPVQQQSNPTAPSPVKSTTAFLQGASNFEIGEGDFDAIRGDAIDAARHRDDKNSSSKFLIPRGLAALGSVKNAGDKPIKVETIANTALDNKLFAEGDASSPGQA